MRQNNLLAPTRVGAPRGPRNQEGTIIPDTVDVMWGTDLTTTITGEGQAAVFVAVDHCSAECVGIHAHPASKPWSRSGRACGSASAGSARRSPAVWPCGMTMDLPRSVTRARSNTPAGGATDTDHPSS